MKILAAVVAAATVMIAGCTSSDFHVGDPDRESPATTQSKQEVGRLVAWVEDDSIAIYSEPDTAAAKVTTLASTTSYGSPRVLLVEEARSDWLRVQVPIRPNGTTGWVRSEGISLRRVDYEVVVDREANRLRVLEAGDVVMDEPAAVGTGDTPTPTGGYFITDLIKTEEPDGPYGPFAFGVSAYSEVLETFAGGNGQVGIHGTNDEASIGEDVSRGCVRLTNEAITTLADMLPLGTPVTMI